MHAFVRTNEAGNRTRFIENFSGHVSARPEGDEGMNILHLKYAVSIADNGSINKAAEEIRVAQPNLSRVVRELEADGCAARSQGGRADRKESA